jgi:hypothetical protein
MKVPDGDSEDDDKSTLSYKEDAPVLAIDIMKVIFVHKRRKRSMCYWTQEQNHVWEQRRQLTEQD